MGSTHLSTSWMLKLPPPDMGGSDLASVSAWGKQHPISTQSFHDFLLLFIYLFIGKTLKTDG